jgi:heat shock protein 1/8
MHVLCEDCLLIVKEQNVFYLHPLKPLLRFSYKINMKVDSLAESIDFNITITRAKFEELCMPIFKETIPPVEKVLKDTGLSKN